MPTRKLLRAIGGPHLHGVFPIAGPVMLGRAPQSDIQIVDPGVSRQHARLDLDAAGDPVVTDLESRNGTFVQGARVRASPLLPGDVLRIGGSAYVYDRDSEPPLAGHSPVFTPKLQGLETLRQTQELPRNTAPPADPRADPAQQTRREIPAVRPEPTTRKGSTARLPAQMPAAPRSPAFLDARSEWSRTEFARPRTDPTATSPQPEVPARKPATSAHEIQRGAPRVDQRVHRAIDTLVRFRGLALRESSGEALRLDERERLRRLEQMFRNGNERSAVARPSNRRRWLRIPVELAAEAAAESSQPDADHCAITIEDIGAGGLRFTQPSPQFRSGDVIRFRVDIDDGLFSRHAIFQAKVVWADEAARECGAIFVGPGRFEA